jgi:Calcineurin-like phosphoesterase
LFAASTGQPAAWPAHGGFAEPWSRGSTPKLHIACSVQSQVHGASIIVTTACWAGKGEGGTGDAQIKSERALKGARNIKSHSMSRICIVCISDTHGQHAKLSVPDGDVLIHAGDFMKFGNRPQEIVDFNRWLAKQPHRFKVVIAGNHDLMFERHPGVAKELLGNAIYLENSGAELAGLKIWGSLFSPSSIIGLSMSPAAQRSADIGR